jgi:hypothetical protein
MNVPLQAASVILIDSHGMATPYLILTYLVCRDIVKDTQQRRCFLNGLTHVHHLLEWVQLWVCYGAVRTAGKFAGSNRQRAAYAPHDWITHKRRMDG